jgi:hypothetical protein
MSIIIKNISTTKTLELSDLGDTRTYGVDGIMAQSCQLVPNQTKVLASTDEARNSLLTGDIAKFIAEGSLQLVSGTAYFTKQVVVNGVAAAHVLGLKDVISVVSILAFVAATGAPAVKTLLTLTTDYTVASGDVTCVTDQSANKLVVTYLAL